VIPVQLRTRPQASHETDDPVALLRRICQAVRRSRVYWAH